MSDAKESLDKHWSYTSRVGSHGHCLTWVWLGPAWRTVSQPISTSPRILFRGALWMLTCPPAH